MRRRPVRRFAPGRALRGTGGGVVGVGVPDDPHDMRKRTVRALCGSAAPMTRMICENAATMPVAALLAPQRGL